MKNGEGCPVRIRGAIYPSIRAAARAVGVHPCTVSRALDEGRVDDLGVVTRKGGHPGTPCWYRGNRYPSVTVAAVAWGVSKAAVSAANRRRRGA
jgi:hypothetical protein